MFVVFCIVVLIGLGSAINLILVSISNVRSDLDTLDKRLLELSKIYGESFFKRCEHCQLVAPPDTTSHKSVDTIITKIHNHDASVVDALRYDLANHSTDNSSERHI